MENRSVGIWVIAEMSGSEVSPVTFELISKARELADSCNELVEVAYIGDEQNVGEMIAYGADVVHILEADVFGRQIDEHRVQAFADLLCSCTANVVLIAATEQGRGISARLAGVLQTGLTADCTKLEMDTETGLLLQTRPAFVGSMMATIKTPVHRPQMASVRPGVMPIGERNLERKGEVKHHNYNEFAFDSRIELISNKILENRQLGLSDSNIIIGVGKGVGSEAAMCDIRELASRLGAVIGGSRAAVELGLVDAGVQIGQTGQSISPDLYIAIGISGQIQHSAAIGSSKCIIAINRDSSAPIFSYSDYGLVGDLETVIPQLLSTL